MSVTTEHGSRIAIASMAANGGKLSGHVLKVANQPVKLAIVVTEAKAGVNGIATRQGSPASGVFILLVPRDRQSASEQLQTNQSDLDGSFDFPRVPAGYVHSWLAIEDGKTGRARPEVMAPFWRRGVEITVPADAREINLPRQVEAQAADSRSAL